ncbi:aspartyl/glutamyl-tRNA amidotransferase subunit C [Candidatus Gracilibacteria bacterium 28_42_T64]|nr:aspartyl/glutamyl-tRNA amidotransferase subunit C [Candidatus Gracilibacteria bacterium 28_42_T64]
MSLTQEQIEKLLKNLSKITTDNKKLGDDANEILQYIELLNEVDTTGVKSTVSVIQKENTLRADIQKPSVSTTAELLACSNQKVINNQIAIGAIMK